MSPYEKLDSPTNRPSVRHRFVGVFQGPFLHGLVLLFVVRRRSCKVLLSELPDVSPCLCVSWVLFARQCVNLSVNVATNNVVSNWLDHTTMLPLRVALNNGVFRLQCLFYGQPLWPIHDVSRNPDVPRCSNGVAGVDGAFNTCCSAECGLCANHDCAGQGYDECCVTAILAADISCGVSVEAPCIQG